MALYPFWVGYHGSNIYGYVVLGAFLGLMGLISAAIFHGRSRVAHDVKSQPLLQWKNPSPDAQGDGSYPDEVIVAKRGMLWGGELIPFDAFHCALVDIWVEGDADPMLMVIYTTRDRVGRKSHTLRSPLPRELVESAQETAKTLIANFGLEKWRHRRQSRQGRN